MPIKQWGKKLGFPHDSSVVVIMQKCLKKYSLEFTAIAERGFVSCKQNCYWNTQINLNQTKLKLQLILIESLWIWLKWENLFIPSCNEKAWN